MPQNIPEKSSFFQKVLQAGEAYVEAQIFKSKNALKMNQTEDAQDILFGKAVTEDPTYAIHASGWKEKPSRIQNPHLKLMSQKDSIVASIIQTRQNQVSNYSKHVLSEQDRGWLIKLRDEEKILEEIKEKLKTEKLQKALPAPEGADDTTQTPENDPKAGQSDDTGEKYDWELDRKARALLVEKFKGDRVKVVQYIKNCGYIEKEGAQKPFHAKSWNLDSTLRAWVRDSLVYDMYAAEIVPNKDSTPAFFFPVDASTIKFSSNRFKDYKSLAENFNNLNLLYPEDEAKAREASGVLDLDEKKLEEEAYKYVQVINGRIERAYTEDEMKIGIRNPSTDIYSNGYGIPELDLLIALVTGHLNAEFYNQAYFTQGFSAKGILHIKAALNRRKQESIRQQWQAMLTGSRNTFHTPIFAGVDDVEWIPLTQNHDDIGFEGWMRYLCKMICAVYQIDPQEIGIGMREEGGSGSGMSGDNTEEKTEHSKDKGLYPLLRHLENFINEGPLKSFNPNFVLCFTGLTNETKTQSLERQNKQIKFCKTVNQIRAENNDPPLPGCDDLILDSTYLSWYSQFSEAGKANQQAQMAGQGDPGEDDVGGPDNFARPNEFDPYGDGKSDPVQFSPGDEEIYQDPMGDEPGLKKSRKLRRFGKPMKVEYFYVGA